MTEASYERLCRLHQKEDPSIPLGAFVRDILREASRKTYTPISPYHRWVFSGHQKNQVLSVRVGEATYQRLNAERKRLRKGKGYGIGSFIRDFLEQYLHEHLD